MLREAGKTDMPRLERYLRANGPAIPRTTLRYAIERFPEPKRRALLKDRPNQDKPWASEAIVTARFKGQTASGKARLETEVLHFRGGDLKLSIPFKQMSKVAARDGTLSVTFPAAPRRSSSAPRRRSGRTRSCIRRRGCRRSASSPSGASPRSASTTRRS